MKIFFRNIHLYLGLAAGLFISIACITGAILVFEEECQHLFHHARYFTLKKGEPMPLAELKSKLSVELGKGKIGSVRIHADPLRNYEFNVMIPDQKKMGKMAIPNSATQKLSLMKEVQD
jgi:uncharacterized iron-regulated membrane protein